METVITMIILVGAAVLFLSNVFRQAKNERERALERSANRPRRPDSNTERFLEEVNRRRQQAQARSSAQPPPVRPMTQAPTITPLPRRDLPTRKPVARTEKARIERIASRSPASSAGKLLEVIAAEKPAKLQVVPEAASASPPSELAMSARSAPPKISRQALPAAFQQLVPLLQSRQSLRAAFMLHEILGPPRCHRR
jgi:hypothetical protein